MPDAVDQPPSRILVVDDDLSLREFLQLMLRKEGYDVIAAAGGREALEWVNHQRFDLVITDIRMQDVDGIAVLKGVKSLAPETVVVMISAFATAETAVTAMKEGAHDYIPKPFQIEHLKNVVSGALAHRTIEAERRMIEERIQEGRRFGTLVGRSPAMLRVYDLISRAAQTSTNILITGESGTGKELVARAVHEHSPRRDRSFIAINCGGMPEQLIESELFGHRKGSFTGAAADKPGLVELADKGTVFLDELAELPLPTQVKLLRVVQEKAYRAVGGTEEKTVDVRFIAATNKELEVEVMAGRFREDLYYRLNVINIHMPPLRDRQGDIGLLAHFFLDKYCRIMGKEVRKISAFALDILCQYEFPGNVRELENIIERSVALEQSNIILPESLTLASFKSRRLQAAPLRPAHPMADAGPTPSVSGPIPITEPLQEPTAEAAPGKPISRSLDLDRVLAEMEKYLLIKGVQAAGGIKQKAAEVLGISPYRLRSRLVGYGLSDKDLIHLDEHAAHTRENLQSWGHETPPWVPGDNNMDVILLDREHGMIREALTRSNGSKTGAAEILGITLRSLHHRLGKFSDFS